MDYNTFTEQDTMYPEDIAAMLIDKLSDLCSAGIIEEDIDENNRADLEHDLVDTLSWMQSAANNPYNADHWRTTYKVLSDLCEGR